MVLSIGELAEAAAVNIQTVRYYERLVLIAPPPRAKNRYRQYDLATVRRLRFIQKAQEIKDLLALRISDSSRASYPPKTSGVVQGPRAHHRVSHSRSPGR